MFETVFRMSTVGSSGSAGTLRSLPISIALHGLAVGAAALLSVRAATQPKDPPVPIVFLEASAAPPPKGDGLPPAPREPAPQQHAVTLTLAQPDEISSPPEEPQQTTAAESSSKSETGATTGTTGTGGDKKGRDNGDRNGVAGSDGKKGTRVGDSQEPIEIGGNVVAPRLIHRVDPDYPEAMRKAHVEGVVVLQAIIGFSGEIEQLQVVKSMNAMLDASALRAVAQWRYRPATLGGFPVRVYLTVTVEFRLH